MPNLIERWLLKRPGRNTPRTVFGTEATTQLLHRIVVRCAACGQSLDGHCYRFFSCHPAHLDTAEAFLAAVNSSDWATVHASQVPALDQAMLIVYAIACPPADSANGDPVNDDPGSGGMVAMLLAPSDPGIPDQLQLAQALSFDDFAALRALCPTCHWIPFTPALQSGQEIV